MPRRARPSPGGYVYHVLNRGVGRMTLFEKPADYAAFERIMAQVQALCPMRILAYCLMPNHWHMALGPESDGDLPAFMQRLTVTHAGRWQRHFQAVGQGHVYQGRYKSFPVQSDGHFLALCRYIERNPLRARLVHKAENWQWSSLWRRLHPHGGDDKPQLSPWPVPCPPHWLRTVQEPQTQEELEAMRRCIQRSQPLGTETWTRRIAKTLGLDHTLRPRGRPKKESQP